MSRLCLGALLVADGRYLVEAKPLHTIISTTVYAEVKKARKETTRKTAKS